MKIVTSLVSNQQLNQQAVELKWQNQLVEAVPFGIKANSVEAFA